MSVDHVVAAKPRRRGWVRRLSWLWVLILGVLAYLLVLQTLVATKNPNFAPSLILLGSVIAPSSVLVYAASRPRAAAVSPALLAFVAVAGGIIGTVAAGTLEYRTLVGLGAMPMIMVGLIEEAAKLLIPILVLLFAGRRLPVRGGVIVGIASGMGFATLETMGYAFSALLQQGGLAAMDQTLLLRGLLSPAGHVAWTGLTVAALWRVRYAPRKGRAILLALGTFVLAVLLHAAWDGFNSLIVHIVVGLFSFVALIVAIHRTSRRTD